MFELLNKALIAQVVLIQMMAAMAFVEYKLALNPRNPHIVLRYLAHVIAQAFVTFLTMILVTFANPNWDFELKSSWPWIFGVAGVAVFTSYVARKTIRGGRHGTA